MGTEKNKKSYFVEYPVCPLQVSLLPPISHQMLGFRFLFVFLLQNLLFLKPFSLLISITFSSESYF